LKDLKNLSIKIFIEKVCFTRINVTSTQNTSLVNGNVGGKMEAQFVDS